MQKEENNSRREEGRRGKGKGRRNYDQHPRPRTRFNRKSSGVQTHCNEHSPCIWINYIQRKVEESQTDAGNPSSTAMNSNANEWNIHENSVLSQNAAT